MSTVKVIIVEHPVDLRWLKTSRQDVYKSSEDPYEMEFGGQNETVHSCTPSNLTDHFQKSQAHAKSP
ncbi:hypothetical protein RRG08_058573 [Elysia crispata]|uniref:Uncharacterized protein n=1 Tax=Elysia crispata TaxID=231223 RepID=A0AAE1CMI9_9GAST|nr:hypothetical protein RRG08_058573 [Elysia crispata]